MGGSTGAGVPAISVIVPTYNRARFLPDMLASVFGQDDAPPFEVILVDDASSDDTASVVAGIDLPVRLVRLERNGGVARARRTGVEHARGALLAFHDSDDLMLPGRLGVLAHHLAAHPDTGAVFANGAIEAADGSPNGRIIADARAAQLHGRRLDVRDVLRNGLPMYLQTALIRRDAFERAGGINTQLVRHADLELACRLVLTTPVVFLDVDTFRYRLHASNQTRDRLPLREGLAEVMRTLRTTHPECVTQCGADWFRWREARHLRTIALEHLRRARLARAVRTFVRALAVAMPRPTQGGLHAGARTRG
jgi:glycosyltransferase involved in cell wall biosynthesis